MGEQRITERLEVGAQTRNLAAVREFLHEAIRRSALPGSYKNRIVLAVDEAVANTMQHGHPDANGTVEVIVEADHERFLVRVRDTGESYDFEARTKEIENIDLAAHIQSGARQGLGLFIMRRVMDEVHYSARPGQPNELTLIKYMPSKDAHP